MGIATQSIGKKVVKAANSILDFAVLALILLLVAYSCYALWDSDQVHNLADAAQYEVYKPSVEAAGGPSFAELQSINAEVFSWITVYGTNIDYPMAQGADNMKYVNTDAKGEYSLSGSIFLDAENSKDFSDFNSIIYGHHMEKKTMFGEIGLFKEKEYFDNRAYETCTMVGRTLDWNFLHLCIQMHMIIQYLHQTFKQKKSSSNTWITCCKRQRLPAALG